MNILLKPLQFLVALCYLVGSVPAMLFIQTPVRHHWYYFKKIADLDCCLGNWFAEMFVALIAWLFIFGMLCTVYNVY